MGLFQIFRSQRADIEERAPYSGMHGLMISTNLWNKLWIIFLPHPSFFPYFLGKSLSTGRISTACGKCGKAAGGSFCITCIKRIQDDFYAPYSFFPAGNRRPGMEYYLEGVQCPHGLWMNPCVFPQFINPAFWGAARAGRVFPQYPHLLLLLLK